MSRRPLGLAAMSLLGAIVLSAGPPPVSAGATRIIAREGPRNLIAISPSGRPPKTLFRLRKGALLSTGASSAGTAVVFASRTWDRSSAIPVWTDRAWIMRNERRAHPIRSFIRPRSRAGSQIDSIAASPDGRHILIAKRNGATFTLRAGGTHLREVLVPGYSFGVGGGGNSSGPEFTPDGRRIIGIFYPIGADENDVGGIGTISIDEGRIHFLRVGPFRNGVGFAFAPRSLRMAMHCIRHGRQSRGPDRDHEAKRLGCASPCRNSNITVGQTKPELLAIRRCSHLRGGENDCRRSRARGRSLDHFHRSSRWDASAGRPA
jgi:hypothetical protein